MVAVSLAGAGGAADRDGVRLRGRAGPARPRQACAQTQQVLSAVCGRPRRRRTGASAAASCAAASSTPNDAAASRATTRVSSCSAASTQLNFSAAATAVIGPGLTVTVTDPGARPGPQSDVSKERVDGSRQIILDRDLQLVVNSLWASGAEAISVGGVRIGPNVTIRQAGGGILVDNNPTSQPVRDPGRRAAARYARRVRQQPRSAAAEAAGGLATASSSPSSAGDGLRCPPDRCEMSTSPSRLGPVKCLIRPAWKSGPIA